MSGGVFVRVVFVRVVLPGVVLSVYQYDLGVFVLYWVGCATSYSQVILCSMAAMLHCPHNRYIFSIVSPKHLVFAQAEMMVIFVLVYIQMCTSIQFT